MSGYSTAAHAAGDVLTDMGIDHRDVLTDERVARLFYRIVMSEMEFGDVGVDPASANEMTTEERQGEI